MFSVSRRSTSGSPSIGFAVGSFSVIKGRTFFNAAAFSLVALAKAVQSSNGAVFAAFSIAAITLSYSSDFLNVSAGIALSGYTRKRSGRSTVTFQ